MLVPPRLAHIDIPDVLFWYGVEDKSINFLAVMRSSRALSRNATASEMIALTGGCCIMLGHFCRIQLQKGGLHTKQRCLNKEGHITSTLATDGDVFRFFRMDKEGQVCVLRQL